MNVLCPPCSVCGQQSTMDVDVLGYFNWRDRGMLIQDAFPSMPKEEREMLITGIHPECWKKMCPPKENDNA